MKRFFAVCLCVVLMAFLSCTNLRRSSTEEALYISKGLPDFQELIQYFSVSSGYTLFAWPGDPYIFETEPNEKLKKGQEFSFVHVFIYKTKTNTSKAIFLSDLRPPKIVNTLEWK